MIKKGLKYILGMLVCLLGICGSLRVADAAENTYSVSVIPVITNISGLNKNGVSKVEWGWDSYFNTGDENISSISSEVELASKKTFTNARKFTISVQKYATSAQSLSLKKSYFGTNGGKFYIRIRIAVKTTNGSMVYGKWCTARECNFVAINKKNFPGMYKLLKNGSRHLNIIDGSYKKVIYDKNGDKWIDDEEANQIYSLNSSNTRNKKTGAIVKAPTVSSFKGCEFFPKLSIIQLAQFSGTKIDLTKNKISTLNLTVKSKKLTVNVPTATTVHIQPVYGTKIRSIDLSRCKKAISILAYGDEKYNATKTLKLPKEKKALRELSISRINAKSLNLNQYKNLQQLYVYNSNYKSVKVNKCKELRYIYMWYCNKMKGLKLSSNKKLIGADFYKNAGLTKSNVKRPKGAKVTWNKGKWWYGTKAYKKLMNKMYKKMH